MDRLQIRKDILALVDEKPMHDVDVAPIIQKHTAGLEISEQQKVRGQIETILSQLKEDKEIDYYNGDRGITGLIAQEFVKNNFIIHSTHHRVEKLEAQRIIKEPAISIGGNVIGSAIGSSITNTPQLRSSTNINTDSKKKSWIEVTAWVVGVVAGLIAIWEFILKQYFH